jgi:hypothetical protein
MLDSIEWNEPEEVSFTQQTLQDAMGDGSGSEDGSRRDEDSVPSSSRVDNPYVQQLWDRADLHILRPGDIRQSPQLALFNLFMTRTFLDAVWSWTNESLEKKGRKKCTKVEFKAYVRLDMGMSSLHFNDIKKYWATGSFLGSDTFRTTMSRDHFIRIRSCVCFHSPTSYDADEANDDHLWTFRSLLDNFIKGGASVAVPLGVITLDECTCATKARSHAKTYLPIKPDKYGIRFYTVGSHRYCYISSFFDNRAGNQTGISGPTEYHRLFWELRTPYYKVLKGHESIKDSPSALWILMMGHQTKLLRQNPKRKRIFFCDNFYTRHTLAAILNKFTDEESRLIGTVKFTNVDSTNRYHLSKGVEMLKDARRGAWVLVQAFNKHPQFRKLQRDHATQQRQSQPALRQPFVPPFDHVAENSGFIILKDSNVVVFYSNNLKSTLPERIMNSSDTRAVEIVHGLATIYRWTGMEVLHRSAFLVATRSIISFRSGRS